MWKKNENPDPQVGGGGGVSLTLSPPQVTPSCFSDPRAADVGPDTACSTYPTVSHCNFQD